MKQICFFIIPTDTEIWCVEHLPQLITDQIDNGLKIQLGGETLLNGVDDLQLGDALLLGFEETLGLIEETGVLERSSQRSGDGGQQA